MCRRLLPYYGTSPIPLPCVVAFLSLPATDYNDPAVMETIVLQYQAHIRELTTEQPSAAPYSGRDAVLKDGVDLEIEADVAKRLHAMEDTVGVVGGTGGFSSELARFYVDYAEGSVAVTAPDGSGAGECTCLLLWCRWFGVPVTANDVYYCCCCCCFCYRRSHSRRRCCCWCCRYHCCCWDNCHCSVTRQLEM